MTSPAPPRAPRGDLSTFTRERFEHEGFGHDVYRKGSGPAVLVITEVPGISPMVLGFADRVAAMGCTAVLPSVFGIPGREPAPGGRPDGLYGFRTFVEVCVSREFSLFVAGRSSPIVSWLRALAAKEHDRCGGPGVGVVGMCLTGGFALAMASDPRVLAPVLSQPSLPLALTARQKASIDCDGATLDAVAQRCAREGLRVLGLRFEGDRFVPAERFAFLRERLGDGFVAVELSQADGHPNGPMPWRHSVLTTDLVDAPGTPTHDALGKVLALFRQKLLAA